MATNRSIQTFLKSPIAEEYANQAQKRADRWMGLGENISNAIQMGRNRQLEWATGEAERGLTSRGLDIQAEGNAIEREQLGQQNEQFYASQRHEKALQEANFRFQHDENKADQAANVRELQMKLAHNIAMQDDAQAFEKMMAYIQRDIDLGNIDAEQARDEALMTLQAEIDKAAAENDEAAQGRLLELQSKLRTAEIAAGGEQERLTQTERYGYEGEMLDKELTSREGIAAADRNMQYDIAKLNNLTDKEIEAAKNQLALDLQDSETGDEETDALTNLQLVLGTVSGITGIGQNDATGYFDMASLPWAEPKETARFKNTFYNFLSLTSMSEEQKTAVMAGFDDLWNQYEGQTTPEGSSEAPQTTPTGQRGGGVADFIFSTAKDYAANPAIRYATETFVEPVLSAVGTAASGVLGTVKDEEREAYDILKSMEQSPNADANTKAQAKAYRQEIEKPGVADIQQIMNWLNIYARTEPTPQQYGGAGQRATRGL